MRRSDGVPAEIGDLSPTPDENRPFGWDIAHGPGCVTDDHLRALAAYIAQLHARVQALESSLESRK